MKELDFGREFWAASGGVLVALTVFGLAYNRLVARLEYQGHDRGYMGFIVAFGVFVTLTGASVIVSVLVSSAVALVTWVVMLVSFVFSGVPMILGSVVRYARARARNERELRELPKWLQWLEGGDDKASDGQNGVGARTEQGDAGQQGGARDD